MSSSYIKWEFTNPWNNRTFHINKPGVRLSVQWKEMRQRMNTNIIAPTQKFWKTLNTRARYFSLIWASLKDKGHRITIDFKAGTLNRASEQTILAANQQSILIQYVALHNLRATYYIQLGQIDHAMINLEDLDKLRKRIQSAKDNIFIEEDAETARSAHEDFKRYMDAFREKNSLERRKEGLLQAIAAINRHMDTMRETTDFSSYQEIINFPTGQQISAESEIMQKIRSLYQGGLINHAASYCATIGLVAGAATLLCYGVGLFAAAISWPVVLLGILGAGLLAAILPLAGYKKILNACWHGVAGQIVKSSFLDIPEEQTCKNKMGWFCGSISGALIGAGIGTVLLPGIGTMIGAGIGFKSAAAFLGLGLKNILLTLKAITITGLLNGFAIGFSYGMNMGKLQFKLQLNLMLMHSRLSWPTALVSMLLTAVIVKVCRLSIWITKKAIFGIIEGQWKGLLCGVMPLNALRGSFGILQSIKAGAGIGLVTGFLPGVAAFILGAMARITHDLVEGIINGLSLGWTGVYHADSKPIKLKINQLYQQEYFLEMGVVILAGIVSGAFTGLVRTLKWGISRSVDGIIEGIRLGTKAGQSPLTLQSWKDIWSSMKYTQGVGTLVGFAPGLILFVFSLIDRALTDLIGGALLGFTSAFTRNAGAPGFNALLLTKVKTLSLFFVPTMLIAGTIGLICRVLYNTITHPLDVIGLMLYGVGSIAKEFLYRPISQPYKLIQDAINFGGFFNAPGKLRRLIMCIPFVGKIISGIAKWHVRGLEDEPRHWFKRLIDYAAYALAPPKYDTNKTTATLTHLGLFKSEHNRMSKADLQTYTDLFTDALISCVNGVQRIKVCGNVLTLIDNPGIPHDESIELMKHIHALFRTGRFNDFRTEARGYKQWSLPFLLPRSDEEIILKINERECIYHNGRLQLSDLSHNPVVPEEDLPQAVPQF